MYWEIIYISPCCGAKCERVKDRLAGRHVMRCKACNKLVSKSRCTKESHPV